MITFQNTSLKKKLYHSALSVIYSFCFNCWNSFINTKVTETKLFQSFFYFYKGHCSTTAGNISRFGLFGFFFFQRKFLRYNFISVESLKIHLVTIMKQEAVLILKFSDTYSLNIQILSKMKFAFPPFCQLLDLAKDSYIIGRVASLPTNGRGFVLLLLFWSVTFGWLVWFCCCLDSHNVQA